MWGFSPAAIWQFHCGSHSPKMLQGWALQPFSSEQVAGTGPGCLFWEIWTLLAWQKRGALSRGLILLGGVGWFWVMKPIQGRSTKISVLLSSLQPQQQRHKKCPYQGWSFNFLMCNWHLKWPLSFLHLFQAREAPTQPVPGKSMACRFSSHTPLESRLTDVKVWSSSRLQVILMSHKKQPFHIKWNFKWKY